MKIFFEELSRICDDKINRLLWGIPKREFMTHERTILDSVISHVEKEVALKIEKQLSSRFYIDRSNPRMNVISVGQFSSDISIDDINYEDLLFKVTFFVDDKNSSANVTFYKRFLFSVETRLTRKSLIGKVIQIKKVSLGSKNRSLSLSLDRLEHGNDPEM